MTSHETELSKSLLELRAQSSEALSSNEASAVHLTGKMLHQNGRDQLHTGMLFAARSWLILGPYNCTNVIFVEASSQRHRPIGEICALIGALLQDACIWDDVLTDDAADVERRCN